MSYSVKINEETRVAIAQWLGRPMVAGEHDSRCPAHHRAFFVVADAALLTKGDKVTKNGKIGSRAAARRLESTCREIAAGRGVKNITTFVDGEQT